MPESISVRVEVTGSFQKELEALGKRASQEVISSALKAGATVLASSLEQRCPRDKGIMAEDVGVKLSTGTKEGSVATIGFLDPYTASKAYWVDKGHINRAPRTSGQKWFKRKGTQTGMTPAHPFMYAAFDTAIGEASKVLVETLEKAITAATPDSSKEIKAA